MHCKFVYLAERIKRTGSLTLLVEEGSPKHLELLISLADLKEKLSTIDSTNLEEVVNLSRKETDFLNEIIDSHFIDKVLRDKSKFNVPVIGDAKGLAEMIVTIIKGVTFKTVEKAPYSLKEQIYLHSVIESLHPFVELDFDPSIESSSHNFDLLLETVLTVYEKEKFNLPLNMIFSLADLAKEFYSKVLGEDYREVNSPLEIREREVINSISDLYDYREVKNDTSLDEHSILDYGVIQVFANFESKLSQEEKDFAYYLLLKDNKFTIKPSYNGAIEYLKRKGLYKPQRSVFKSSSLF